MICQRCHDRNARVKLRRVLNQDAVDMVGWRCLNCNEWASKSSIWLKKMEVAEILQDLNRRPGSRVYTVKDIPLLVSYLQCCEMCGQEGAQWHHWLPQSIHRRLNLDVRWLQFQALLCDEHHRQWHEAVTFYLSPYSSSELASRARRLFRTDARAQERQKRVDAKP